MLGKKEEALQHYLRAITLKPAYAKAHNNLGALLASEGKLAEAVEHYEAALLTEPNTVATYNNLGLALNGLGKSAEAAEQYRRALQLKPDFVEARYNLGAALAALGRWGEAAQEYAEVVRQAPESSRVHYRYGLALAGAGKNNEAIVQLREAVRLKPDQVDALNLLARLLAASASPSDISEAIASAERAVALTQNQNASALDTLALAYAASHRFDDAADAAQKALELATKTGQKALADQAAKQLELFRQKKTR
jgi:tetratricopeptide (TPR) repeat protein